MKKMIYALLLLAVSGNVMAAGSGALTDKGIKAAGSAMAFLDMCELAGYAPDGITQSYRDAALQGLTRAHWDAVERQYRASLQERMFYLSSRDQWLPFDVEPVACEQITKVSEKLSRTMRALPNLMINTSASLLVGLSGFFIYLFHE